MSLDKRFDRIDAKIRFLKWECWIVMALTFVLLLKVYGCL